MYDEDDGWSLAGIHGREREQGAVPPPSPAAAVTVEVAESDDPVRCPLKRTSAVATETVSAATEVELVIS